MKTAEQIEERNAQNSASTTRKVRGNPSKIIPHQWKPGQSGNPGGRPKNDIAAEIARAVFEQNTENLYKAFAKSALQGNAYVFKELADRGYGKQKETVVHEGLETLAETMNKLRKQKNGGTSTTNSNAS
jgi:hypothetical protein